MIILDSNVLSEMLRERPEPAVVSWMARQSISQMFTTAVTEAEIRFGVVRLDPGHRKDALLAAVNGIFAEDMAGRILPFDGEAAQVYAQLVAYREQIGRPISQFDAQIAAIAATCGADVATRNIRDFELCGLDLINPWEA